MGRITAPKNKQARREGVDLSLKTFGSKAQTSLLRRLTITPGKNTTVRRMRKLSDYGKQLREKQKVKRIYGLSEKGLKKYFDKAVKAHGNTYEYLIRELESRLDNVLYRLRLTPTRASARQLVTHGHVKVNGKKMSIPSLSLVKGDKVIFANNKTADIPYVKELLDEKNLQLPHWLKRQGSAGEVIEEITVDDFTEPVNMSLVVEFYSKL